MLNNVVLVNRKPLKAKHIIGYASEVLSTPDHNWSSGAVNNKGPNDAYRGYPRQ